MSAPGGPPTYNQVAVQPNQVMYQAPTMQEGAPQQPQQQVVYVQAPPQQQVVYVQHAQPTSQALTASEQAQISQITSSFPSKSTTAMCTKCNQNVQTKVSKEP
eukprot:802677_1